MSFESLVKKLMKEGKSKTAATKIAGSVANAKMKGAGSGPTAKQKARAKSPATKKRKPRAVIRDKDRVADKSRSYTDKKGRKIEIKTFKHEKAYDSGVKDDPNKPSMKRKSSRLSNTVELHKTKTKKDGTTKTKVKRAAGGGKKSQRLHTKFAKGKNKKGSSDVIVNRKSPTTMKKQGYNARLDDSLGAKNGKKKQSMKSRRDESEGMEKSMGKRKYSGNKSSDRTTAFDKKLKKTEAKQAKASMRKAGKSPAKMKSPAKKPLVGGQKRLPKELQEAILKAPAKMLSKSGIKMMDKSPAMMKETKAQVKARYKDDKSKRKAAKKDIRKGAYPENAAVKAGISLDLSKGSNYSQVLGSRATAKNKAKQEGTTVRKSKKNFAKGYNEQQKAAGNPGRLKVSVTGKLKDKSPAKKSKQKVEQDYARNAIADYKSGKKKEARYEKKKALEVAAGESGVMMKKSPATKKDKVMFVKTKTDKTGLAKVGKGKMMNEKKAKRKVAKGKGFVANKFDIPFPKAPMNMKTNQDGGGYAAKNMAAPARQLKRLGSILSKHMKSK